MPERTPHNTKTLQNSFPEIYREFFASSGCVASASNSFMWMGEFAGFYNGITINQKLPLRSYVGFEYTFDNKISLDSEYVTFESDNNQFCKRNIDEKLSDNIRDYLEHNLIKSKNFSGIIVHILTEVPMGHGLGANGAIAAALALLVSPKSDFDTVYGIAREILSLNQAGHSSGSSAYAALSECNTPIIFFNDEKDFIAKPITGSLTQEKAAWPIDFGLIYSGAQTTTESVVLAHNHTIDELDQRASDVNKLLDNKNRLNFKSTFVNMLNMVAGLTVDALSQLLTKGAKKEALENLFTDLNQYQNLMRLLDASTGTIDLLYSRIHQIANKQNNDVGSGVKISGLGKGGAVLFAVPYGTHRGEITDLIQQIRNATGRSVWLDYASWLDGTNSQPGLIEQDLEKDVISSFIEHDTLSLKIIQKGVTHRQYMTKEKFEVFSKKADLIIDKTTGKISISGKALTSKELPSQKATAEIFSSLLSSSNFQLSNDSLPASYGINRYDLQGKITIPLKKQIKKITGRDLQLDISGNAYSDFTLTLNPTNILITVIESKL